LRAILAETIDFDRLAQASIKLFITATNVRTGRGHLFGSSHANVLATICQGMWRFDPRLE
jgi:hypothetical protein